MAPPMTKPVSASSLKLVVVVVEEDEVTCDPEEPGCQFRPPNTLTYIPSALAGTALETRAIAVVARKIALLRMRIS
jgi:hypothetical protein